MNKKFVWIGAGSATSPHFSFDDFDSIVLVEARKEACDELNEHFEDNVKVKTKQVCISERNGESAFFQCNVEELSALAKPALLKSLYPGLKVKSYDVDTVSIIDFFKEEIVDGGIELFIDTPATSWVLVRELSKSKFLDSITKLHVSIGTVPALYEESADFTELASLLREKCFEEVSRDSDDPDIPVVSFKLNESLKAIERLKAENSALKQQLMESTQYNEKITHKANKLNSGLAEKSELIEAKDVEIQALNRDIAKYKADFKKKSLECDELCNQLNVSKSSTLLIENKLTEEQAKVAKLTKELEEHAAKLKKTEEIYDGLKDDEKKISEELINSKSRLAELAEKFDAQAKELQATLETVEQLKTSEIVCRNELAGKQANNAELISELEVITGRLRVAQEEMERAKASELNKGNELSKYETKLKEYQQKFNEVNAINVNLSKSIDISAKQNLKLQTDLDDLRQQFSANQENEARLKSLISDLYEKLSRAASFYHRLEKSNPELLGHNDD